MTVFIEVSFPFQAVPTKFRSRTMTRYVWLWFAVGWLHVPFQEFVTNPYTWDSAITTIPMADMKRLMELGRRYGRRLGTKTPDLVTGPLGELEPRGSDDGDQHYRDY